MNTIFKYNANAKYSTKDLKGGHNRKKFSLLNIYLDEKGLSVKNQLPNIFKDHPIVAQPIHTTVGYDEWSLSFTLWRKFYNSHGKYKPELNENGNKYILFRIDIYFTKYSLAVEIDEKAYTDRDIIFEEEKKKALEKRLRCTFTRINTSKKNFKVDYEAGKIQTFICNFNKNKIKELEDKRKNLSVKNNVHDK